VRVEITLIRVGITFVLVEITLRVEIKVVSVIFTRIRVKLTVVWLETKISHSPCGNRTLRPEINLLRVGITLLHVVITFVPVGTRPVSVIITLIRIKITLIRFKITFCV
jgi:hypothetical protein